MSSDPSCDAAAVLDPTNLLVAVPAAASGLVLSPAFYIWLGIELRRR